MYKSKARVVKKGSQWCVVSEDGSKNLGCSSTKEGAEKRLQQVEYFKHAKGQDMNYEQAFRNMAKSLHDVDPKTLGKEPDAKPRSVNIESDTFSISERLKSGSIAGRPSERLLDNKDHFPILTETQARSSMSRAMQLSEVPAWYSGTLSDLRKDVYEGILNIHPAVANSICVKVPIERVAALSDGQTPSELTKTSIKDPAKRYKDEVPQVKRPTITTADLAEACKDDEVRSAIAGQLMECIKQQEEDLANAKKIASKLMKSGVSSEQFDILSTYLQSNILQELIYNDKNASTASMDSRRRELLDRLKASDNENSGDDSNDNDSEIDEDAASYSNEGKKKKKK